VKKEEFLISSKPILWEELRLISKYRNVLYVLSWRNLRLQYNSFWLGLFWGVLNPMIMTAIFFFVLGNKVGSDLENYILYIYSGFIFWNVLAGSTGSSASCFQDNFSLIKKVYFPRFLMPFSHVISKLPDLAISFMALLFALLYFNLDVNIYQFAFFTLLSIIDLVLFGVGLCLIASVLTVRFKGFSVIQPLLTQAFFFVSPIIFDINLTIENSLVRALIRLNVFTGILEIFRFGIFNHSISTHIVVIYSVCAFLICICGLVLFNYEDVTLSDKI